ncbi:MAG: murein hydrolase activator EnvC family protein [Verrucomicrobiota bacterium]
MPSVTVADFRLPVLFSAFLALSLGAEPMRWPTPHPAPAAGGSFEEWAQPTVSGDPISALFGCVRNDGARFHEGIDITPFEERRRGEATDLVMAAWRGEVVHVNRVAGDSGYGRYVVVRHDQLQPGFVTLYAHLATIPEGVRAGAWVEAGAPLGVMGRSAGGYSIPRQRAHLHFEIALRLSDDFQTWYDAQGFGNDNEHGPWNGMNLIGLDPWEFWLWQRAVPGRELEGYFRTLPTAFVAEVTTREVPSIVRRHPGLLTEPIPASGVAGWRVAVTGWGMPLRFTPLPTVEAERPGTIRITAVDPVELASWTCRDLVRYDGRVARLEVRAQLLFELLFTFEME